MLDQHNPREQSGRDSFERYRAQVRSAAIASLSILEGKDIDRVYCDLHDDFVIRKKDSNNFTYIFYQVKTKAKQNHTWTVSELFGLRKRKKSKLKTEIEDIRNSFVGKMLLHTIVFDQQCNYITFQTNINTHDDVVQLLKDIENGNISNGFLQMLVSKFNDCYSDKLKSQLSETQILKNLSKLQFETDVQYLKQNHNFESIARDKVYEFSEIDLNRDELKQILLKLIDLVETKSSGVISTLTPNSIEKFAGISIENLLSILSISREAYNTLIAGGDKSAIKSASIIQRTITNSGGGETEIEYCSKCKIKWDLWLRKNRHIIPEFNLNSITQDIINILPQQSTIETKIILSKLQKPIEKLLVDLDKRQLKFDIDVDLILGGVLAEIVRRLSS